MYFSSGAVSKFSFEVKYTYKNAHNMSVQNWTPPCNQHPEWTRKRPAPSSPPHAPFQVSSFFLMLSIIA